MNKPFSLPGVLETAAEEAWFSSPFSFCSFQPKSISTTAVSGKRSSNGRVFQWEGEVNNMPLLPLSAAAQPEGSGEEKHPSPGCLLACCPGYGCQTRRKEIPQPTSFPAFSSSFWIAKTGPSYSYLIKRFSFCPPCCPCAGTGTVAFASTHSFYMFPEYIISRKHTNTK